MAVKPEVAINIGSEFTGKKAFKQAETATQKLGNSTKNLSKRLVAVFSVTAVLAFGRAVSIRKCSQWR
jgi:anti-sigma-K factor RskA